MTDDADLIGRRLREVRAWRGLSLRTAAELAGLSKSYLSMIERGERPVERRSTVEALANALQVAPSELVGNSWLADSAGKQTHSRVPAIEAALDSTALGEDPDVVVRPWPELAAEIDRLADLTHVAADYVAQAEVVPDLLVELHGAYVRMPGHRDGVLLGLIHCYTSVCYVTKRLGGHGLRLLASQLAQRCADELERPEWRGYTTWLRGQAAGVMSRPQQYRRSVLMVDELSPDLDSPAVLQAAGMLHLAAAHAALTQSDPGAAGTHLTEAAALAARMDDEVGTFARMWFGRTNVAIWGTSLASETGDVGRALEVARGVHLDAIPSPSRQAEHLMDVGRLGLRERDQGRRESALRMVLRAEKLAPQEVRSDVLTREAVGDSLRRARRDAGGRELRGLAYRMGMAA